MALLNLQKVIRDLLQLTFIHELFDILFIGIVFIMEIFEIRQKLFSIPAILIPVRLQEPHSFITSPAL